MRLTAAAILSIFEDIALRAAWVSDPDQYGVAELWADLKAKAGGKLTGDCEDWALSWLHALLKAGQPLEWRRDNLAGIRFGLVAMTVTAPRFDHCVLIVPDADGVEWVLDCNRSRPVRLEEYDGIIVEWGIGGCWKFVETEK